MSQRTLPAYLQTVRVGRQLFVCGQPAYELPEDWATIAANDPVYPYGLEAAIHCGMKKMEVEETLGLLSRLSA